jgi:hypothetical protein
LSSDHTAAIDRVLDRCRLQGDPTLSKREACRLCAERPICPVARSYGHLPAYLDCPTCPLCGSRTGIGHLQHMSDRKMLRCAACGNDWIGTEEQVAQAERADASWEKRSDERRGPRAAVVRKRARRPTEQLGLFVPKKEPTDE